MVSTLCTFLAGLALYLILAGSLGIGEVSAGVVVALIVAGAEHVQRRCDVRKLRFEVPWLRLLRRSLVAVGRDTMTVGLALLRAALGRPGAIRSGMARQDFRPGGCQPRERGRRAVVTLAGSLAPNGIVVDVPPSPLLGDASVLLVHRLVPSGPSPDREWPL